MVVKKPRARKPPAIQLPVIQTFYTHLLPSGKLTDDNDKAIATLQAHSYAVSTTDVVYIELPDHPQTLAKSIEKLSDAGISVEYSMPFHKAILPVLSSEPMTCASVMM